MSLNRNLLTKSHILTISLLRLRSELFSHARKRRMATSTTDPAAVLRDGPSTHRNRLCRFRLLRLPKSGSPRPLQYVNYAHRVSQSVPDGPVPGSPSSLLPRPMERCLDNRSEIGRFP